MLEQIHPSATKAKDDRYYNMEPDVRNQATRRNYMNFWEQGMHVKHDTLKQSGKVIEIWYLSIFHIEDFEFFIYENLLIFHNSKFLNMRTTQKEPKFKKSTAKFNLVIISLKI